MTHKSFSQNGQDIYVINEIYKGKKNGYFIELGAADGIIFSNTLMLEKNYNWRGLCIEPNDKMFSKLRDNRVVETVCVNDVIYSKSGIQKEFVNADLLSGIINTVSRGYLKKAEVRKKLDFAEEKTLIKTTKTMTELLDEHNAPKFIEYLSLDTEGSEYDILQGIDFSRYTIGYICVEHNNKEKDKKRIRDFLMKNNYKLQRENGVDDEYIHISL